MPWDKRYNEAFPDLIGQFDSGKVARTATKYGITESEVVARLLEKQPKVIKTAQKYVTQDGQTITPRQVIERKLAKVQELAETVERGAAEKKSELGMYQTQPSALEKSVTPFPQPTPVSSLITPEQYAQANITTGPSRKVLSQRVAQQPGTVKPSQPSQYATGVKFDPKTGAPNKKETLGWLADRAALLDDEAAALDIKNPDHRARMLDIAYTRNRLSSIARLIQSPDSKEKQFTIFIEPPPWMKQLIGGTQETFRDPTEFARWGATLGLGVLGGGVAGLIGGEVVNAVTADRRRYLLNRAAQNDGYFPAQVLAQAEALERGFNEPTMRTIGRGLMRLPEYMVSYGGKAQLARVNLNTVAASGNILKRMATTGAAAAKMTALSPSLAGAMIERFSPAYRMTYTPDGQQVVAMLDNMGAKPIAGILKTVGLEFLENWTEMGTMGIFKSGGKVKSAEQIAEAIAKQPKLKSRFNRFVAATLLGKYGDANAIGKMLSSRGFDGLTEPIEELPNMLLEPLIERGEAPKLKDVGLGFLTAAAVVGAPAMLGGFGEFATMREAAVAKGAIESLRNAYAKATTDEQRQKFMDSVQRLATSPNAEAKARAAAQAFLAEQQQTTPESPTIAEQPQPSVQTQPEVAKPAAEAVAQPQAVTEPAITAEQQQQEAKMAELGRQLAESAPTSKQDLQVERPAEVTPSVPETPPPVELNAGIDVIKAFNAGKEFVRLFRGDAGDFEVASLSKSDPRALFGQAIYLSDKKRLAGDYASKGGDVEFTYHGSKNSTKQDAVDAYIRQSARWSDENGVYQWRTDDTNMDVKEAYWRKWWDEHKSEYDIRHKLDGTTIIQKKAKRGKVTAVDLPKDYLEGMLDAEGEIPDDALNALGHSLREVGDAGTAREMYDWVENESKWNEDRGGYRPSYREVYTSLLADSPLITPEGQSILRRELKNAGYNGIAYAGGITMGGMKHRAFAVWDEQGLKKTIRLMGVVGGNLAKPAQVGVELRAGLDPTQTLRDFGQWLKGATDAEKIAEAKRQYEAVELVRDEQGRLLAPNGQPSRLNERQWRQVRMPFFKAWFGDWENDPANASKVVDENGEPLVVYHGSPTYKQIMESGVFSEELRGKLTKAASATKAFFFGKSLGTAIEYATLDAAHAPFGDWFWKPSNANDVMGMVRDRMLGYNISGHQVKPDASLMSPEMWDIYGDFAMRFLRAETPEARQAVYRELVNAGETHGHILEEIMDKARERAYDEAISTAYEGYEGPHSEELTELRRKSYEVNHNTVVPDDVFMGWSKEANKPSLKTNEQKITFLRKTHANDPLFTKWLQWRDENIALSKKIDELDARNQATLDARKPWDKLTRQERSQFVEENQDLIDRLAAEEEEDIVRPATGLFRLPDIPDVHRFRWEYGFDPSTPGVVEVFLDMRNPAVKDYAGLYRDEKFVSVISQALKDGRDGCIFKNVRDGGGYDDIHAVFKQTQIKSASANRGTYDTANPNILRAGFDYLDVARKVREIMGDTGLNRYLGLVKELGKDEDKARQAWQEMMGGEAEKKAAAEPQVQPESLIGKLYRHNLPGGGIYMVVGRNPDGMLALNQVVGRGAHRTIPVSESDLAGQYSSFEIPNVTYDVAKKDAEVNRWKELRGKVSHYGYVKLRKNIEAYARSPLVNRAVAAREWLEWDKSQPPVAKRQTTTEQTKKEVDLARQEIKELGELADAEHASLLTEVTNGIFAVSEKRHKGEDMSYRLDKSQFPTTKDLSWLFKEAWWQFETALESMLPSYESSEGGITRRIMRILRDGREGYYTARKEQRKVLEDALKQAGYKGAWQFTVDMYKTNHVSLPTLKNTNTGRDMNPVQQLHNWRIVSVYLGYTRDTKTKAMVDRQLKERGYVELFFPEVLNNPIRFDKAALDALVTAMPPKLKMVADAMHKYVNSQGPKILQTAAAVGDPIKFDYTLEYWPRARDFMEIKDERTDPWGMLQLAAVDPSIASQSRFQEREEGLQPLTFANPLATWSWSVDRANRYIHQRQAAKAVRGVLFDTDIRKIAKGWILNADEVFEELELQLNDYESPAPPSQIPLQKATRKILRTLVPSMLQWKPHIWALQTVSGFTALSRMTHSERLAFFGLLPAGKSKVGSIPWNELMDKKAMLNERYFGTRSAAQFSLPQVPLDIEAEALLSPAAQVMTGITEFGNKPLPWFDMKTIGKVKNDIERAVKYDHPDWNRQQMIDHIASRLEEIIDTTQMSRDELYRPSVAIHGKRDVWTMMQAFFLSEPTKARANLTHNWRTYLDSERTAKDIRELLVRQTIILLSQLIMVNVARWGVRMFQSAIMAAIWAAVNGRPIPETALRVLQYDLTHKRAWPFWAGQFVGSLVGTMLPTFSNPFSAMATAAGTLGAARVSGEKANIYSIADNTQSTNMFDQLIDNMTNVGIRGLGLLDKALSREEIQPKTLSKWMQDVAGVIGPIVGFGTPGFLQAVRSYEQAGKSAVESEGGGNAPKLRLY